MKLRIPKAPPAPKKNKITIRKIIQRFRKGYLIKTGQYRVGHVGEGVGAGLGIGVGGVASSATKGKIKEGLQKAKEQEIGAFKITLAKEEEKGLDIPSMELKGISKSPLKIEFEEEKKRTLQEINIYYNLIPRFPKKGEFVYAYAQIAWDPKQEELIYNLVEPTISERDLDLISTIRRELEERLDVDFAKLGATRAENLLTDEISKILEPIKDVDENKKRILTYYIKKEIIGLGKIEALMRDPNIEDISCDGVNIPVYVYHRDPKIGSLKTNVVFRDRDELDTFTIKLAQKCHKTISIAEPLLDATLPDGSRVQATLGTDIARKGSNFTIRKFTQEPLTPTHMIRYGTMDSMQLAYLWLAIENKQSILISGGTATGKTSMLNALSLFIKPSLKVVSIEDTAELRLPHPHWIPEVARSSIGVKGKVGEITLFDLLKSSLRQRPDYIIVGEVRGSEAYILFQQIATGHPGMSTIHASSLEKVMNRLTTKPIDLSPELVSSLDLLIFVSNFRKNKKQVRKVKSILEIENFNKKEGLPNTTTVFEWDPRTNLFHSVNDRVLLANMAQELGVDEEFLQSEIVRRKKVLEWMQEKGIIDYKKVGKIISAYYSNPGKIMELVEGYF